MRECVCVRVCLCVCVCVCACECACVYVYVNRGTHCRNRKNTHRELCRAQFRVQLLEAHTQMRIYLCTHARITALVQYVGSALVQLPPHSHTFGGALSPPPQPPSKTCLLMPGPIITHTRIKHCTCAIAPPLTNLWGCTPPPPQPPSTHLLINARPNHTHTRINHCTFAIAPTLTNLWGCTPPPSHNPSPHTCLIMPGPIITSEV